jgi:hypothetical protein
MAGCLTRLKHLSLANNQLQYLPYDVSKLPLKVPPSYFYDPSLSYTSMIKHIMHDLYNERAFRHLCAAVFMLECEASLIDVCNAWLMHIEMS